MQREKISSQEKSIFHACLSAAVSQRLSLSSEQIPADNLCKLYDDLDIQHKSGIFQEVSDKMKRPTSWVAKFYHNTFRKSRYTAKLSEEQKMQLEKLVHARYAQNYSSKCILDECYQFIANESIFPNQISSFVFQAIERARTSTFYVPKQTSTDLKHLIKETQLKDLKDEQIQEQMDQFMKHTELVQGAQSQEPPVYNQFSQPTLNDL
ncbi:Conserved_hypothetical protein [Hexamita inflata]|uniref:Uncharacterized protein n=1 Tax=Hexamita inflata TaxID=28002 RepID=A0ABP1IKJ1_9EUKA